MTNLHIEPDYSHRAAFALWCLGQRPVPRTTSTGFDIPLALYPDVPAELLEGAYVDGFPYGGAGTLQPKPDEAPETPSEPLRDPAGDPSLTALDAVMPKTSTRRRAKRSGVDE